MLCEMCGKYPATTHFKSVINGKVTERHLCSHCAGEAGLTDISFSNIFSSMFNETPTLFDQKRCACCGSSFEDIASTGKAGCSECYETFFDKLLPSLDRLHGHTKHIGVKPAKVESAPTKKEKLKKAKAELDKAVKEERFEDAAKIRDQIKEIEKEAE